MKMFKKASISRNLRRKQSSDTDDENDTGVKKEPIHQTPTPLLSFQSEEDVDVFQVKKKKSHKKPAKSERAQAKESEIANKDHGRRRSGNSPTKTEPIEDTRPKTGGELISSSKKTTTKTWQSSTLDAEHDDGLEALDHFDSASDVHVTGTIKPGEIPDANLIHLARKRRLMARAQQDFIPLTEQRETKASTHCPRLVREDDSDFEEDGGRFYSSKLDQAEEERRRTEADFLCVEQGDSDEEATNDEVEFEQWERDRLKKAVSAYQLNSLQQEQAASDFYMRSTTWQQTEEVKPRVGQKSKRLTAVYTTSVEVRVESPMEVDIAGSDDESGSAAMENGVKKALPKLGGGEVGKKSAPLLSLSEIRRQLNDIHAERERRLRDEEVERDKLQDRLVENQATLVRMEEALPRLSEEFGFYQEMRLYLRDLVECFNEKVPEIERLADELMKLRACRAETLARRRKKDVEDQYEDCQAAAASAAGKRAEVKQDAERIGRVAEREARRTRRRLAREKARVEGHLDGLSSDDEEPPSRVAQFNAESDRIAQDALAVLADVSEDFASVEYVCARLSVWLREHRESFERAYILLCLPKLLMPLVRLELLAWSPLEETSSFEEWNWFQALLYFGCKPEGGIDDVYDSEGERVNDDGDGEQAASTAKLLIPAVVEKSVCPKITAYVEKVWDPFSATQTRNMSALVRTLVAEYPSVNVESNVVRELLEAIVARVRKATSEDIFIPIFMKSALENRATGAAVLLDRQFYSGLKFTRNVMLLRGVLSDACVAELAVDGVLNRYLLLCVQCSNLTQNGTLLKLRAIVQAIAAFASTLTTKQLEPLCKLLSRGADELAEAAVSKVVQKSFAIAWLNELSEALATFSDSNGVLRIGEHLKVVAKSAK